MAAVVAVRAEATDRVKTVCDRVRKTEIDVDKTDENGTQNRGGAERRKLTNLNYSSPERRMAAVQKLTLWRRPAADAESARRV